MSCFNYRIILKYYALENHTNGSIQLKQFNFHTEGDELSTDEKFQKKKKNSITNETIVKEMITSNTTLHPVIYQCSDDAITTNSPFNCTIPPQKKNKNLNVHEKPVNYIEWVSFVLLSYLFIQPIIFIIRCTEGKRSSFPIVTRHTITIVVIATITTMMLLRARQ